MAVLLLVRHAQASFGMGTYDSLSKRGVTQSHLLGQALSARGIKPTLLVSGDLTRHRQTMVALTEAAGWDLPTQSDPGWNEFDHAAVIAVHKPAYRNSASMAAEFARTLSPRKAFQQAYEEAVAHWIERPDDETYPETFTAFRSRVAAALRRTSRQLESGDVALIVTSGGPISSIFTDLLGGDGTVWQRGHVALVNTAVTKVVTGRRGATLVSWNEHVHLEFDEGLVTYR